jgi:hypothetical protein
MVETVTADYLCISKMPFPKLVDPMTLIIALQDAAHYL